MHKRSGPGARAIAQPARGGDLADRASNTAAHPGKQAGEPSRRTCLRIRTQHEHVVLIAAAWQKSFEWMIETGERLIEAKDELPHGAFLAMIKSELPFGRNTAERLMAIAGHPVLSNRAHAPCLPSAWMTLYELTKLDKKLGDGTLLAKIADGTITAKTERKDVIRLIRGPVEKPEPDIVARRDRREATKRSDRIATAMPGEVGPDTPPANPISVAWAAATDAERDEFVRFNKVEVEHRLGIPTFLDRREIAR